MSRTDGSSGGRPCRSLGLRPLACAVLLVSAACGGDQEHGAAPSARNALVVTLDTTRIDALGVYVQRPGLTPNLDGLARESVVYAQARSVAPLTLPSHASMMTGLYPPRHTARDNNVTLPESAETLAERARAAGFATAAFVAAVALDRESGLDQGFDVYDQPEPPGIQTDPRYNERPAREVTDDALAWLAARDPERRFLLWAHYFDPHYPYEPLPEDRGKGGNPYLDEVVGMDREVGRLIDGLRLAGLLGETLVLVVADHGEAFGEHGETSHSAYCYDTTIRVPFLVRHPDGRRAGIIVNDEIVSVVDVFPTALSALGLEVPNGLDGLSLLEGPLPADRGVYFESLYGYFYYGWSPLVGWVDAGGKYLHSSTPELFDVLRDPNERVEQSAARANELERYRSEIAAANAAVRLTADGRGELDQGRVTQLQSLGYAGGSAEAEGIELDPLAPTALPAPATRSDELGIFYRSQALGVAGKTTEAIAGFEKIVAGNAAHMSALYELGQLYKRTGRFEEAVEMLTRSIALGNEWFGPYFNLGVCLAQLGRDEEALVALRRVLELKPDLSLAAREIATILERMGKPGGAQEMRDLADRLERGG